MIRIPVLNGSITLHERKTIYTTGMFKSYLYITCQTDRDMADVKLNREQAEELIKELQASLKW